MTLAQDTAPAPIGHNSGSDAADLIERTLRHAEEIERGAADYSAAENPDLMRRLREIRETMNSPLPSTIASKSEAEKLSDIRFAVRKWITAAKQARTVAKRPWDSIGKAFYAFFTRPMDELEAYDAERLEPLLSDWQEREAARIRREEAERARILREEAERQEREAREAEARKQAAERAEREAREAAERAERDRLAAIAAAEKAKREREEAERAAAAAKKKAAEDEAAAKAAKEAADAARQQEAEAKAAAKKAAEEKREAEKAAGAARRDVRTEARKESEATSAAERAEKKAEKSEDKATAKPADLSRVRGEAGSVSSLRTFYTFRNLDRRSLDLEALRQHIPIGALETAVRSFIDAGGLELRGVEIFEDTQTTTR